MTPGDRINSHLHALDHLAGEITVLRTVRDKMPEPSQWDRGQTFRVPLPRRPLVSFSVSPMPITEDLTVAVFKKVSIKYTGCEFTAWEGEDGKLYF